MGILRGIKLALAGTVGATVAWWLGVGAQLRQYEVVRAALELPLLAEIVAEYGVVLDWAVGVFVGVVVADLVGYLRARDTNRDVRLSSTLGVGKGTAAVAVGLVALAFDDPLFAEFARRAPEVAEFVQFYLGGKGGFCFALGVLVGTVAAEVTRL